jgi:hypothetical protein
VTTRSPPTGLAADAARAARFAAILAGDAAGYLARCAGDGVDVARLATARWSAGRDPARAGSVAGLDARLRARREARWSAWSALPERRRNEVRLAALALVLLSAAITRGGLGAGAGPPHEVTALPPAEGGVLAEPEATESAPPPVDLAAAAERFRVAARGAPPGSWVFLSEAPVLPRGQPGAWDDFRVGAPAVLPGGRSGLRMWYRGCRSAVRDTGCAVGHATSEDGVVWTRSPEPVFVPSDPIARERLHALAVAEHEERLFLWYSVAPDWFAGRKTSTLHLATSEDGLRFEPVGQVLAAVEQTQHGLEPSVLHDGRRFHLWYVDSLRRTEKGVHGERDGAPFLVHATSGDGKEWTESAAFPLGPLGLGRVAVSVRAGAGGYRAFVFWRSVERNVLPFADELVSPDGDEWSAGSVARRELAGTELGGDDWSVVRDARALPGAGGLRGWFVTTRRGGSEEIRLGFRGE